MSKALAALILAQVALPDPTIGTTTTQELVTMPVTTSATLATCQRGYELVWNASKIIMCAKRPLKKPIWK